MIRNLPSRIPIYSQTPDTCVVVSHNNEVPANAQPGNRTCFPLFAASARRPQSRRPHLLQAPDNSWPFQYRRRSCASNCSGAGCDAANGTKLRLGVASQPWRLLYRLLQSSALLFELHHNLSQADRSPREQGVPCHPVHNGPILATIAHRRVTVLLRRPCRSAIMRLRM